MGLPGAAAGTRLVQVNKPQRIKASTTMAGTFSRASTSSKAPRARPFKGPDAAKARPP
ncbi:hypothetical protein GCM10009715_05780 [Paeniglutamicibacter psychrophenolicus]